MSKQDGYASRTAADLERKYNFGQTFAEVYDLVADARKIAEEAQNAYADLNQEQIFNLLTNYGEAQGIYRDDTGNVYMNASYIKSGMISGDKVKVAAAVIEGELTAATIQANKISGGTLDFSKVTAGNLKVTMAQISDLSALSIKADQISGGYLDFDNVVAENLSASYISGGTLDFSEVRAKNLSASRITSGILDATEISLGSDDGGFMCGTGMAYGATTYGAMMHGPDIDYYVFVSGSGVRLQANYTEFYVAPNQVYSELPIVEGSSDRRTKNSISYDMDKYERFFYALKPCFFKFNTRPDDGYNLGFIAQDVEEALLQNELEKSDFTGLTTAIIRDENGEYSERYALILQQFVALNTHMIQKLNKRVTELEALNT